MSDPSLTSQEKVVLRLLWEGLSTREIAKKLGRSYNTIAWYRQRIRTKYGVHSAAAVVKLALEQGVIKKKEWTRE